MLNAYLALRALPWKMIGLSALALALLGLFAALKVERSQNAKLKAQIELVQAARKADEIAYRAAQDLAAKQNLERVRATEQRYQEANDEATRNLNARLERLRSELRSAQGRADQGAPVSAGPSQAPGQSGTPSAAGMCLAPEELLRAAENEERHDQLITLVEKLIATQ